MRPEVKPIPLDVFNMIVQDIEKEIGVEHADVDDRKQYLSNINMLRELLDNAELVIDMIHTPGKFSFNVDSSNPHEGLRVVREGDKGVSVLFKSYTL